jgi:ribosome biogenesis GTPase
MFDTQIPWEQLSYYYDEFQPHESKCWYTPCSHVHEPDCAVIDAVTNGKIFPERYQRYLEILALLKEEQEKQWGK